MLAAAAPAVVGHDALFVGAAIGFLASAAAALPRLLDRGARPPPDAVRGRRDDLPGEHPRIRGGRAHAHPCVIEAHHPQWPHDAW